MATETSVEFPQEEIENINFPQITNGVNEENEINRFMGHKNETGIEKQIFKIFLTFIKILRNLLSIKRNSKKTVCFLILILPVETGNIGIPKITDGVRADDENQKTKGQKKETGKEKLDI